MFLKAWLVFRLDLELNSRYQVEYVNSSGESIVPYESALTVQETLLQSLATIASTSITRMVGGERVDIIPRAFLVGRQEIINVVETPWDTSVQHDPFKHICYCCEYSGGGPKTEGQG